MPKAKTVPDSKQPTNLISVGLPQVPAEYGLKPRKNYLPWSHAEKRLASSRNYWICTSRPDGRPHSMPVWGFWTNGALYFGTGRSTRKGKNLAHNKAVSIHLESGDDAVILEGNAVEVNDKPMLKKLDEAYRAKYKTPLLIAPESAVYCVHPRIAWAWREKNYPNDATRWEFEVSD